MIAAFSPLQPTAYPTARADAGAAKPSSDLETQIARQVASASPDANVDVDYQYTSGANGELVAIAARVTVTQERPLPERLGGTGTAARANGIEDVVQIGSNDNNPANASTALSSEERALILRLQTADAGVRRHEGLHFRAAGGLASTPQYQTVRGPDGQFYAVAGSVDVSSTRTADPDQAAREAQTLTLAATAPGDASAQDFAAARRFSHNLSANQSEASPAPSREQQPQEPGELVDLVA